MHCQFYDKKWMWSEEEFCAYALISLHNQRNYKYKTLHTIPHHRVCIHCFSTQSLYLLHFMCFEIPLHIGM